MRRAGLGQHHIHEGRGDAHHGKAAHERCLRLEQVELADAVDHRRLVLMAVEDADDIVAGDGRKQGGAVLVAPPMRLAAAASSKVLAAGSQRSIENLSQP